MKRTAGRPLARAAVSTRHALEFGLALSVGSFFWLWWTTNVLSALLAAATIAFYVFVYTLLIKRRTSAQCGLGRCGQRHAVDDRLVSRHRDRRLASPGDVRDRLFLDAAPQLGLGDAPQGGLPRRGRADAAGVGHRTPGHQADPHLHLVDRVRDASAGACHRLAVHRGCACNDAAVSEQHRGY